MVAVLFGRRRQGLTQLARRATPLLAQDVAPNGRAVVLNANEPCFGRNGFSHRLCLQALTKFGQSMGNMRGVIVFDIKKGGRLAHVGAEDSIGDQVVCWSLRDAHALNETERSLGNRGRAQQGVEFGLRR